MPFEVTMPTIGRPCAVRLYADDTMPMIGRPCAVRLYADDTDDAFYGAMCPQ